MNPSPSDAIASHHYYDRDCASMAVRLLPSEYFVSTTGTVMTTVLGSCVAACLMDADAGVAGMNHFMLPDADTAAHAHAEAMRYGGYAMDVLVREMMQRGARRGKLQAKVFGGGAVLANMTTLNIGDRNSDFALRYLRAEGITVTAQDLRGPSARRVCFFGATGRAVVKKLRAHSDLSAVQAVEGELLRKAALPATASARPPPVYSFLAERPRSAAQ